MKKLNYLLAALLVSTALGGFAACDSFMETSTSSTTGTDESTSSPEEESLAAPVVTLGADYSVRWTAVEGATGYVVNVNGQDVGTFTALSVPALDEAGSYTIKVAATDGTKKSEYSNSVSYSAYGVTLSEGACYTLTGEEIVYGGADYAFTLALGAGYENSPVVVKANGAIVTGNNGAYVVENVTGALNITVEGLQLNTYAVSLPTGTGYTVTGASSVQHGSNYAFTVALETGYGQSAPVVKVNGDAVTGNGGTYTVESVSEALNITVEGVALNTYQVTFNGAEVDAQSVEHGDTATRPNDPTKAGYHFDGWYTDAACKDAYDFATPVTENLELYGQWISNFKTDDQSTWYETSATMEKVDGTHTRLSATDNQIGIKLTAEAISHLSAQGYDKVEFAVKANTHGIQIYRDCLRHSASVVGVTISKNNCVIFTIDITEAYKANGLEMLIVTSGDGVPATVSLTGTKFDENDQATWYSVSTSKESVGGTKVKFTTENTGTVYEPSTLTAEAVRYLAEQGYTQIKLTVTSLTGHSVELCKDATGWTTAMVPDSGEKAGTAVYTIDITDEYKANGVQICYFAYNATAYTVQIGDMDFKAGDQSTWYETSATVEKVDGAHTKFTASDNQIGIKLTAEAISALSAQGYDKVEFTVKTDTHGIQIYRDCLRHSASVTGVTNSQNNCVIFTIEITEAYKANGLEMLVVTSGNGVPATVSLKGTSFDANDQSTWYSVSTSKESVESGGAVKFTTENTGTVYEPSTLTAEAVQYLASQGYTQIQLTVTSSTGSHVQICKDTDTWTTQFQPTTGTTNSTATYLIDIDANYQANGIRLCYFAYNGTAFTVSVSGVGNNT